MIIILQRKIKQNFQSLKNDQEVDKNFKKEFKKI